jgi:hypothetical protein
LAGFILTASTQAMALERQLAGVSLGARMVNVLKRYGNPTRVAIGSGGSDMGALSAAPSAAATPGNPAPARDLSPFAGLGSGLGPGALPGLSSIGGMPGMGPAPIGMPGASGQPGSDQSAGDEVRWTYDVTKGPTLEFIVNDGLVSQVTVSGSKPWVGAKTSKGVGLGDNYKKVLLTYGYPDRQEYVGRYLRVGYLQRSNVMFTLRDSSTVVGITIGLKQ